MLVHGAAGGVGTARCRSPRGSARGIAVVSSDEKERVAREAGADEVLRSDGPWKDQAKELPAAASTSCSTRSAATLHRQPALAARGRPAVVVGFTGGSIPEVKVNRLLLNNIEVVGAGWGAYVLGKPEVNLETAAELHRPGRRGFVRPIVGERFPLERAAEALKLIDERGATGKVVLELAAESPRPAGRAGPRRRGG